MLNSTFHDVSLTWLKMYSQLQLLLEIGISIELISWLLTAHIPATEPVTTWYSDELDSFAPSILRPTEFYIFI